MKKLISAPNRIHPGRSGLGAHCCLKALFGVLLVVLLSWSASAQLISDYFTNGFGIGAQPAVDQWPGTNGNGWGTGWFSVVTTANGTIVGPYLMTPAGAVTTGGSTISTLSTISPGITYAPLNPSAPGGGSNYVLVGSAALTKGKVGNAIGRGFAGNLTNNIIDPNGLNLLEPYTIQFDIREECYVQPSIVVAANQANNTITNKEWSTSADYVTIQQCGDNPVQDDTSKVAGFWVKAQGATTPTIPSLTPYRWNFFQGNPGATAESQGVWLNSGVLFDVGHSYHFLINYDPVNNLWSGTVTDLVTLANYTSPKLYAQAGLQSLSGFLATTNIVLFNKVGVNPNSNFVSIGNVVWTQAPTNTWPPVITPLAYDTSNSVYVVGRSQTSLAAPLATATSFSGPKFFPYTSNFTFLAATAITNGAGGYTNTIPASGVHLSFNGVDVSSQLTFTGTDASNYRFVSYVGLQDNTLYSNIVITVTDSGGNVSSNLMYINTFDPTTSILFQAINFDFDPLACNAEFCPSGLPPTTYTNRYIENWLYGSATVNVSNTYYGLYSGTNSVATEGVDYQGNGIGGTGSTYRPCDIDVNIRGSYSKDFVNPEPFTALGVSDSVLDEVGLNASAQAVEWFNYTYFYNNNSPWYIGYLRGFAFNSNFVWELDQLATGFGTSPQTSNYLGQFNMPAIVFNGQMYDYLATDATGTNTAMLYITNGQTTLTLSNKKGDLGSNKNGALDYLVLLPVPQPTITSPTLNGTTVSFTFNSIPMAHYTVKYTSSLSGTPVWSTLTTVNQAPGTSTLVTDTVGAGQRFYQVSVP